jgi:TP901 family phage tail tape measure protein
MAAINLPIVSKFDDKGIKRANKALAGFGKAAAGIATAATAAVAGIAVKSIQEFAKFDEKLNQSIAIMGDVSEAMRGEMSDAAREVAKTTTFSADQAAESFFFLASAGLDAEAAVAAMPAVARFAQAGMFDMALATDLATDAQSALGLSSKDAQENLENLTRITDVFVKANTLANTSVEQLATAFTTKAGTALKTVGKDVEEGAAALALFADQGVKGEIAGTQLTNTIFGLTDRALKAPEAFEKLGISVFDAEGNMRNFADIADDLGVAFAGMTEEQKLAELGALGFTKQARAGVLMLAGQGDTIRDYESALRDAGGTAEEISGKQLQTFAAQMELLKSRVADVGIEIGGPLVTALLEMTDDLGPIIDDLGPALVEFFQALMPVIKAVIAILPQVLNVAAPALEGLSAIISDKVIPAFEAVFGFIKNNVPTIATFVGVLGGLTLAFNSVKIATALYAVAQGALNAVLALNPFIAIAVAVAAVAAGIVYLATRTTFFQDTWKAVTTFAKQAWEGFGKVFSKIGENIGKFFTTIVTNISEGWKSTMDGVGGALKGFGEFFKTIWNGIGGFFKNIVNGYIGLWEGFINGVIGGLNGIIRAANSIKISIPSWIPGLGGQSFGINLPQISTLKIPRLADGGMVMPQPGGVFANIAEAGRPEVVIPLDRMKEFGGGGGTFNITVNAGMGADGGDIGRKIVDEIIRYERGSGRVFARA